MSSGAPTLINLPPPPSDPATPSEIPGTPNSSTTVMSELSTVAIKDGHHGHAHHHPRGRQHFSSSGASDANTLDAERADRISRLAGLERLSTVRQSSNTSLPAGASAAHPHGYFDPMTAPSMAKERSTVGSASATGSLGGRTTWTGASTSDDGDTTDKMSEDQEMETGSTGGFSEEGNGSLVGFGEGASSTVSGPVSTGVPGFRMPQRSSRSGPSPFTPTPHVRDPRNIDGMTYDQGVVDTAATAGGHRSESGDTPMNDRSEDGASTGGRHRS